MALTTTQCQQFNDFLGRRPFPWDKNLAKDRKPQQYIYLGMYAQEKFPTFAESVRNHEKVYVTRANDPGMWPQFFADPCLGTPCDNTASFIGHGIDQLSYGRYKKDYQSAVFCLDLLNTVEEGVAKMAAIMAGYKDIPEQVAGTFIRQLSLRSAGIASQGGGLWLCGVKDVYGNPTAIDVSDAMFQVSTSSTTNPNAGVQNALFINLNATGGVTALFNAGKISAETTAGLIPAMSQLTMEYLRNHQEDLAAQGYHDKEWLDAGKFSITMDDTTSSRLLQANPELRGLYKAADFAKAGAFYSLGMNTGCGDWLFKRDPEQMRFQFRGDLDGHDLLGNVLSKAIWIEQVQPFQNVGASFGLKPIYDYRWKNAPIALYHCFHREARTIEVGDIENVNPMMKFGLSRSFMGDWKWHSPEYFTAIEPATGTVCAYNNPKRNKGYLLGEYDLGIKVSYPEIERLIFALREPTQYVVRPNTNTPPNSGPQSTTDYQSLLPYNGHCGDPANSQPQLWGQTPFAQALINESAGTTYVGASNFFGYQTGIAPE